MVKAATKQQQQQQKSIKTKDKKENLCELQSEEKAKQYK